MSKKVIFYTVLKSFFVTIYNKNKVNTSNCTNYRNANISFVQKYRKSLL